jgi:hypothetical protein
LIGLIGLIGQHNLAVAGKLDRSVSRRISPSCPASGPRRDQPARIDDMPWHFARKLPAHDRPQRRSIRVF